MGGSICRDQASRVDQDRRVLARIGDGIAWRSRGGSKNTGGRNFEELPGRARELGLEGLIGKRTRRWIKLKLHLEQEFVIGGYTDPEGGRKYFGSLLVGFYEGKNLKFAGRVGTGFSDQLLRSLYSDLEKIRIERCPFFNVPAVGRSRWNQGLIAAKTRPCHWVKPVMVCRQIH